MASGFRNSIHCSTPTREENTSVEPGANQRPPTSSELRPAAYIKGSAVSSIGHWHKIILIDPQSEERDLHFFHLSFSRPLFSSTKTMADTQVDSGSDISAKVSRLTPPHTGGRGSRSPSAPQTVSRL